MTPTITDVKDKFRVREIHVSTGNKYIVTQTDPYGLWVVHSERGQLPQILCQKFTEFEYARRAIETYLSTVTQPLRRIEKVVEAATKE